MGGATRRAVPARAKADVEKKPAAPARGRRSVAAKTPARAAKAKVTVKVVEEEEEEKKTPSPRRRAATTPKAVSVRKSTRKVKKEEVHKMVIQEEEEEFPNLQLTPSPPPPPLRSKELEDKKIRSEVKVVLKRIQKSPIKKPSAAEVREALEAVRDSPKRVELVIDDLLGKAEAKTPSSPLPGTARTTRSVKKASFTKVLQMQGEMGKKVFAPANKRSSPKSNAVKPRTFYGTPQMADPISLLRGNLKNKVKASMEEKVAKMPPTSPYELTEEENSYKFTRVADKPSRSAKKYVTTGTPGHAPPKARRVLGAVSANTPKRKLDLAGLEDDAEQPPAKMNRTDNDAENSLDESVAESPVKAQPQLVTGDLARACVIM